MKSIVLTGMMGSGKTTCGRLLARRLGRRLADTDQLVVADIGMPIADYFALRGEAAFRDAESAVCRRLSGRADLVIATGGGAVLRPENVAALKARGVVVFLNRPAGEIFDSTSMDGRPLAQDGRAAFLETFARREPVYRAAADVVVTDFSSPEATAAEILRELERLGDVL